MEEIVAAWEEYNSTMALSVLKNGKWVDMAMIDGFMFPKNIEGTRASMKKLRETMSFPKFLETIWIPKNK
jgi:hypothetical protein